MRLVRLRLENFKRISDCTIDISLPINALIGRNNSGKSSVLGAIFACTSSVGDQGAIINRGIRDGVAVAELAFSLTRDEWAKLMRISGIPNPLTPEECGILEKFELTKKRSWRYADGRLIENSQSIDSPQTQQINIPERNKIRQALGRVAQANLADTFGVALLSTAGRRLSQDATFVPYNSLRGANPLDQFSSWLYHLKRKDAGKYQEFVYEIKSVFPEIETLDVNYNLDTGEVILEVKENGVDIQGGDMGAGWHSMLALYSYMLSPDFSVLLLDEPDTHMHSGLVRLLSKFLETISHQKQVILATHHPSFINSLPVASLWHFEESMNGKSSLKRTESSSDLLLMLQGLGIEIPNEVVPTLKIFESTRAAQTVFEGVDAGLDIKQQLLLGTKDRALSYYPQSDLSALGRDLTPNGVAHKLGIQLLNCPKGQEGWRDYQVVCTEILSHTLSPPLLRPLQQTMTEGAEHRRDITIYIPFGIGGFWGWIQSAHEEIALIVDCKNYAEPVPTQEITLVSKYFGERRLGRFGIVLTRLGVDEGAREEIKRLWSEQGVLLLPLSDEDLLGMLKLKEHGGRPEAIIDARYKSFREALSR